jgi:heterodisulfide reductase subunit B
MIDRVPLTYSYYPGCSLMVTNRAYDISARSVARALGIELLELDDWNCCGATAYMAIRERSSLVLSARNLAIAEREGRDLATLCNACWVALRKTNRHMAEDSGLRTALRAALKAGGMDYHGSVRVRHFLEIIVNDLGEAAIRMRVRRDLSHLRVACYSGCQFSRPFADVDSAERPRMMERLCSWLGAQAVSFPMSAKCCGGMSMTTRPNVGRALSGKILSVARQRGANCIATACPLCQVNLEAYQPQVGKAVLADVRLPVLYFTQLMGAAFGLGRDQLALQDSLTPVEKLLAEKVGADE